MNLEQRKTKILDADFNNLGWDTKRERILLEQNGQCKHCDLSHWREKQLTLEIDHIDGDKDNNTRTNLVALCPNCHSLTDTWRGRNVGNRGKITDEALSNALRIKPNIKQALEYVGLVGKGKNYVRARKLLEQLK